MTDHDVWNLVLTFLATGAAFDVIDVRPTRDGATITLWGNKHCLHYVARWDAAREAYSVEVPA